MIALPGTPPLTGVTLRLLAADERATFQPLLDSWLRPGAAISSSAEAPLLLGPTAHSERLVAFADGHPVAHAALFHHRVHVHGRVLQAGVIGAVATDPAWRGHGLAGQLLEELATTARNSDIDLLVLWATETGLYERAGFVRAGREWIALWHDGLPPVQGRVRRAATEDIPELARLHDAEAVHTERSLADWEQLFTIPAMQVFVALTADGSIKAFAACGKGIDLVNCIHEWAGAEDVLPALATHALTASGVPEIYIMGAPHQEAATERLLAHGAAFQHGALGMLRILKPTSLAERFRLTAVLEARGSAADNSSRAGEQMPQRRADLAPEVLLFGDDRRCGLIALHLAGLDSM